MRACDFEGCNERHVARGACRSHYSQLFRGDELTPITQGRVYRDSEGKLCRSCNTYKSFDEFHRNAKTSDGRQTACKECRKGQAKVQYKRIKEEERINDLYEALHLDTEKEEQ